MRGIKSDKGITLLAISVLIIVMIIVTAAIIYRTMNMYKIKALNDMNNDIRILEDNIGLYYSRYNTIPILEGNVLNKIEDIYGKYEGNIRTERNLGDNDKYFVIDLNELDNISLSNGKEFAAFKNGNTEVSDIYVINELTLTVYYIKGVVLDDDFYCTLERNATEINTNIPQIANPPLLTPGMIPIKWNGTAWIITTQDDMDWFNYNNTDKKWANVMLSDGIYKDGETIETQTENSKAPIPGQIVNEAELGSMFVWIPRYAYKISNGLHSRTSRCNRYNIFKRSY